MGVLYIVVAIVVIVLLLMLMMVRSYKKVPPNQAMIIYGFGGKRVVQGGGAFVIPGLQSSRVISMTLMSFDVLPDQEMLSHQGIPLKIEAVAQIKIKSDPTAIQTAAEQFLERPQEEIMSDILHSVEGHLRAIVGRLPVESILKEPDHINSEMRTTCSEDLDKMGLEVVSFTIKKVSDNRGYIESLGVPEIERVRKEASIAKAEAVRDINIKQAEADKEAAIKKAEAQQAQKEAESMSQSKQAEFQKNLALKEAEFKKESETARAEAEMAYELQQNKLKQQITMEEIRVKQVAAESDLKVREAEVRLKEQELQASVIKPAEAEKQSLLMKAEAEKQRQVMQAEAEAEATKKRGEAEAEAERAKGRVKAEVVRLEGLAEAEATEKKAEAYEKFNNAAITIEILRVMPELAEKIAAPLANIDKVTIISQDGATTGASKIVGDVTTLMSQIPELTQAMTGASFTDLVQGILGKKSAVQAGQTLNEGTEK